MRQEQHRKKNSVFPYFILEIQEEENKFSNLRHDIYLPSNKNQK